MSDDRPPEARATGLIPQELARYRRHLVLPEVGMDGQLRLRSASVLIVGAGGLGSPTSLYLAAAGVGRLGLVDFDRVDLSNLQRQILYGTGDVGSRKLEAAARRLRDVNPHVAVEVHDVRLGVDNALALIANYDVVIDGTDNFPSRFLVNDACVMTGKPNVYGSVFRFEGQVSVFGSAGGPCYRCLYPEPPPPGAVPNCAEGGVLGVLPGVIGTLQATEALKLLLGRGNGLVGRLLLFNALEMQFRELKLRRDPACAVCGERPTIRELIAYPETCAVEPADGSEIPAVSPQELGHELQQGSPPFLLDVRTPQEWQICRIEGATLIPVQVLDERCAELTRDADIVVYCHSGIRSAAAVGLLRRRGFGQVRNLTGGIDAWALTMDPAMPRY